MCVCVSEYACVCERVHKGMCLVCECMYEFVRVCVRVCTSMSECVLMGECICVNVE